MRRVRLPGACCAVRAMSGVREWRRERRAHVRRYERRPTTSYRARQAGGLCTRRPTAGALPLLACGACGSWRVLQGVQVVRRASGAARFDAIIYMMPSGIMISCRTVFSISGRAAARRGPWRRGALTQPPRPLSRVPLRAVRRTPCGAARGRGASAARAVPLAIVNREDGRRRSKKGNLWRRRRLLHTTG